MRNLKLVFIFFNKIYVVGSQKKGDVSKIRSFEHPKHMLRLMGKLIIIIYAENFAYLILWKLKNNQSHI